MPYLKTAVILVIVAALIPWAVYYDWFARNVLGRPAIEEIPEAREGEASFYGEGYRGRRTASGQLYDPDGMSCATNDWPLGTWLVVEHEGLSIVVRVNDRGPSIAPRKRIIDLSQAAFGRLASHRRGIIPVKVRPATRVKGE